MPELFRKRCFEAANPSELNTIGKEISEIAFNFTNSPKKYSLLEEQEVQVISYEIDVIFHHFLYVLNNSPEFTYRTRAIITCS